MIWAIVVLCSGIELTLMASDAGWLGSTLWRSWVYQNGAFWAGLLYNWRPNYPTQPWTMFVTYAFLHGGFWHLAGNMLTLLFLGEVVLSRLGQTGFLLLYVISALGGAAMFALLTTSPQPMVGASGALFGLAGAWLYWDWSDRREQGESTRAVWHRIGALILLNLVLWAFSPGGLAWETHLGGFVAGWAGAWLWQFLGTTKPARD